MILDLSEFNSTTNSDSILPTLEDIIDQARAETQDKTIPTTSDSSAIKTRSATKTIEKSKAKKKTKKRR